VADDPLAQVRAFLAERNTLTLATLGPDGNPQAADLYYAATDDLTLYFVSVPGSRHAVNIARNPSVAVTVHADSNRWRDIRGVQLEGMCVPVTGADRARAWARYTAKFPFVLADAALPAPCRDGAPGVQAQVARALQKVSVYRITPRWLRWIDNTAGLGHNQEWALVDGEWQTLAAPES
jgi:uncharacterized protein YhbP (UPF0306 family)